MLKRIEHKLADQRGASLSMALMLMLVCVAISSIVLAAATTSAGRIAESGKADQRYYAVTSAVRLFEASLDGGNAFTCTERYYSDDTPPTASIQHDDPAGYDFLEALTYFALSGKTEKDAAESALAPDMETWVMPFDSPEWGSATTGTGYVLAEYQIARPTDVGDTDDNANLNIVVEARMRADWSLELVFSNAGKSEDSNDRFKVYMLLQADVDAEEYESEYSNPQVWERETSITWECVSIQQGRGFPSD